MYILFTSVDPLTPEVTLIFDICLVNNHSLYTMNFTNSTVKLKVLIE